MAAKRQVDRDEMQVLTAEEGGTFGWRRADWRFYAEVFVMQRDDFEDAG